MSVYSYFDPRTSELRMPRQVDELGIRYKGPVLTGKLSVDEALAAARQRSRVASRELLDRVLRLKR